MTMALMGARAASIRRFGEVDWDFPEQLSESLFSDLHWHPCRFPSQIPAIAIGRLTEVGDTVLDPFMGSGTTLIEAQRLGRSSVGIDINPIACLLAEAKTLPISARQIEAFVSSTKSRLNSKWSSIAPLAAPEEVQLKKWYTPATGKNLQRIWAYINDHSKSPLDGLLKAAFSAILLPACRETRHWGYVCDNSMPKSNRERDVLTLFCDALDKFARAYLVRDQQKLGSLGKCKVIRGDAVASLAKLPDRHFSCFVTSPPYFGVADYVKAQRLSMEWFGFEIEPSRKLEIGARSKRHRKSAALEYISELGDVFREVYRVLKRGAWGVVLYGESPVRASAVPDLVDELTSIGFRVELKKSRQIPETRRQFPSIRDEYVILMRKA